MRSTDDTRDTSENKIFGQLAFDKVLSSTMAITDEIFEEYDGYTPLVDTLSTYALRLDLESDVDEGTWFLVELPDGWSKDFGQDSKCRIEPSRENTPAVEGNFYCDTVG